MFRHHTHPPPNQASIHDMCYPPSVHTQLREKPIKKIKLEFLTSLNILKGLRRFTSRRQPVWRQFKTFRWIIKYWRRPLWSEVESFIYLLIWNYVKFVLDEIFSNLYRTHTCKARYCYNSSHHAGFLVWFLFQIIHEVSSQTGFEARHCNLIIYNEKGLVYLNVNILPIWSEISTENRWQIKLRLPFMLEAWWLAGLFAHSWKSTLSEKVFLYFSKANLSTAFISKREVHVRGIGHRRSRVYSIHTRNIHQNVFR